MSLKDISGQLIYMLTNWRNAARIWELADIFVCMCLCVYISLPRTLSQVTDTCFSIRRCWCCGKKHGFCHTSGQRYEHHILQHRIGIGLHLFCLLFFYFFAYFEWCFGLFMAALWNRADHYIFALWFLSIFFIPCLISVAADWMSTILRHMMWL